MRRIYLILFLALMVTGCKQTQPVVLPRPNIETKDSVQLHYEYRIDTIWIERNKDTRRSNDTVFIHDSIVQKVIREVKIEDTIHVNSIDTVYVPIKTPTDTSGNRFLRDSGIALWILIVLFVIAAIIGVVLKFAK